MVSRDGEDDGHSRRASTVSISRSSTVSHHVDDLELTDVPIADGFRPSQQPQPRPSSQSSQSAPSSSSTATATPRPAGPTVTPLLDPRRNRPSSVSKPPRPHDSLSISNDGSNPTAERTTGTQQPMSMSSDGAPVIRQEGPYRGPSNPSHPYQMYLQRALSTATSSTAEPSRDPFSDSHQAPAHPYALYTQTTAPGEDAPQQDIPIGFSGLGNAAYQRRLGPDGEEAGGLVGPLGHTEELPPYTRYPEMTTVKPPTTEDGAGGLGIATRNPEFSSTEEDLAPSPTRPSVRSAGSDRSHHDINAAAAEVAEEKPVSKWQRRAKNKLWGVIPYWAICLVLFAIVMISIIMGALLGTLLHDQEESRSNGDGVDGGDDYHQTPTTVDVIPLTTVPSGIQPIPTGGHQLPPLDMNQSPRACFKDPTQAQAWSCDLAHQYYALNVSAIVNATETSRYELTIAAYNDLAAQFIWGTQPPDVPKAVPLQLVTDTFEKGRGPAWWMKATYNKTVIVSDEDFPTGARDKRSADMSEYWPNGFPPSPSKLKRGGAEEGDTPWMCTWPNTSLEIFIFPNQNTRRISTTSSAGDYGHSLTEDDYTSATPYPSAGKRGDSASHDPPMPYPKLIKFLERRLSGESDEPPTCRHIRIVKDGSDCEQVLREDGTPAIVEIQEKPNSWNDQFDDRRRSYEGLSERDIIELTDCGCLWWST